MRDGTQTLFVFFFFNDTATTEIYTLSLHDALPISAATASRTIPSLPTRRRGSARRVQGPHRQDRKSTRLNSSHSQISYAVFCLKKKKDDCAGRSKNEGTTLPVLHDRIR